MLDWKITWHFLLICISRIILLLLCKLLLACCYLNLTYSQKYSLFLQLLTFSIYTAFLQHVGAKKVFAKTAFQIWQVLLQFYDHFLKFRKCFGQWLLFYSCQCFIVCVFYGSFLPINIFIKPLTTRNNCLFFLKPDYNLLFWTMLQECLMQRHYSTEKHSPTTVSSCNLRSWCIVLTSYGL